MAAHSSALVLRKKLKSGLPSCCGPSLSISFAIAITANRSALSKVTANLSVASCQARSALAFHSTPEKFKLIVKAPLQRSGRILVKAGAAPAFGRTGQILVADLGDRPRHLGFRAIAQLNDRQTGAWRHEAKQAQRIFQGSRAVFGKRGRQRRQPVLQISGGLQPSLPAARKNCLTQSRRDIRYHRYAAIPAIGKESQRGCVVSGQQSKPG